MAEHQQYQLQRIQEGGVKEGIKSILPDKCPSTSQILAVVALLTVGGTLLALSGLTLAGTLFGLVVTTPFFVICSPVLVPAGFVIGLAVLGFLTSGSLGITALSSLCWMVNYFRKMRDLVPDQLERAKRKAQETAVQLGQKPRETGQVAQGKAQS